MSDTVKILLHIIFTVLIFTIFVCLSGQLFAIGEILLAHLAFVWVILSTVWNFIMLKELV